MQRPLPSIPHFCPALILGLLVISAAVSPQHGLLVLVHTRTDSSRAVESRCVEILARILKKKLGRDIDRCGMMGLAIGTAFDGNESFVYVAGTDGWVDCSPRRRALRVFRMYADMFGRNGNFVAPQ